MRIMIILVLGLAFCAAYIATAILFIIFGWEMSSAALWTCIIILTIAFTALYYFLKGNADEVYPMSRTILNFRG